MVYPAVATTACVILEVSSMTHDSDFATSSVFTFRFGILRRGGSPARDANSVHKTETHSSRRFGIFGQVLRR